MEDLKINSKIDKISLIDLRFKPDKGDQELICGIEYKDGKFALYGKENMEHGARVFFALLAKEAKKFLNLLVEAELERRDKK